MPTMFVYESMMESAEEDQIVEVGRASVGPVQR